MNWGMRHDLLLSSKMSEERSRGYGAAQYQRIGRRVFSIRHIHTHSLTHEHKYPPQQYRTTTTYSLSAEVPIVILSQIFTHLSNASFHFLFIARKYAPPADRSIVPPPEHAHAALFAFSSSHLLYFSSCFHFISYFISLLHFIFHVTPLNFRVHISLFHSFLYTSYFISLRFIFRFTFHSSSSYADFISCFILLRFVFIFRVMVSLSFIQYCSLGFHFTWCFDSLRFMPCSFPRPFHGIHFTHHFTSLRISFHFISVHIFIHSISSRVSFHFSSCFVPLRFIHVHNLFIPFHLA